MTPIVIRYPYDITGVNPNNLVSGEKVTTPTRRIRAIAPQYGPFYSDSVKVRDITNNRDLVRDVDFVTDQLYQVPTEKAAKTVESIILIVNQAVSNNLEITYQSVGGEYSYSVQAILDQIENLDLDNRPVEWGNIINRPDRFVPTPHLHDFGDVYGLEYLVNAVYRVRDAILLGDVASHDEIYSYIDMLMDQTGDLIDHLEGLLNAHIADIGNPHKVTATQVGAYTKSETDAKITAAINALDTTLRALITQTNNNLAAHVGNQSNPHKVTKAQVGLDKVENYELATTAQAQAGAINTRYMTPALTKAAIDAQIRPALNAHIANENNPHKVTAAQTGAYTKAEVDTMVGRYLPLSGTEMMTGTLLAANRNMAMSQDWGTSNGSIHVQSPGSGDAGMAGITFTNPSYGIRMGLRSDGYFGLGGLSRSPWSWYSDSSGNMIAAGDIRAYSDPRLKEDVVPLTGLLDKFKKLSAVAFTWKDIAHVADKAGKRDFGVMADEVLEVFPEAVGDSIELEGEVYKSVAYQKLVAPLIGAVNELSSIVETQAKQIELLVKQSASHTDLFTLIGQQSGFSTVNGASNTVSSV